MRKPLPKSPLAAALGTALLISGCAIGPDFLRPASPLPERYEASAEGSGEAAAATPAAPVHAQWWTLFDDAYLNTLMTQALENNQDLLAAAARMEAAQAAAREAGADYYPGVNLDASSVRSRTSGETANGKNMGATTSTNRRVALGVSYELDIWGRIRRSNEAARAQALSSTFARDALRLSLAGQVADEYLNLRALDAELQVTRETLESQAETLKIVRARVDAGADSALELSQAQASYANAQAQLNQLQRQRALSEHQLGLLAGQPSLKVPGGDFRKLPLPPLPPVGLPSSLLEARPDVRQAEETLVAANARIGVAKAAYFPSISLTGLLGSESASLSNLFIHNSSIWSYGAALAMPIFNAGKTAAQVDQATAGQKEALANYLKTVQTSFREVKDALVTLKEYSEEEIALAAQVDASRQALNIAKARYEAGYVGFLSVLDSQRTYNSAQLLYLELRKNRLSAAVDLFKALGGGWQEEAAQAPAAE